MSEPKWLPIKEVIIINKEQVAITQEPFFLRDFGLLDSALSGTKAFWFYDNQTDIAALATDLLLRIANNHPFEQGNKRTAFVSAMIFFRLNGFVCAIDDTRTIADLIIATIERKIKNHVLEGILRDHSRSR